MEFLFRFKKKISNDALNQELENFIYEKPDGKYLQLCWPRGLQQPLSSATVAESSPGQQAHEQTQPCSNRTLFIKPGSQLD